jgi:hypothetical protein
MCELTITFLVLMALPHPAASQSARTLFNDGIRAEFAGAHLAALIDLHSGFSIRFADETFSLTVDGDKIDPKSLVPGNVQSDRQRFVCSYRGLHFNVKVIYELRFGWRFLSKQIVLEPLTIADYRVNEIEAFAAGIAPSVRDEFPLSRGSWGMLLRFAGDGAVSSKPAFGAFFVYQNPFNVWKKDGQAIAASYAPEIDWRSTYGPYISDRFCIGLYPLSGTVFPARAVPEWTLVSDYQDYLAESPRIDMAEADALVECVRSFLLYRPQKGVRVHVPWCENDYQIDVANQEGWQEYKRIIDRAVELGCQYTLFTPANSDLSSPEENRDAWG